MRLSLKHYRPILVCRVHILYEELQNEVLGVFCSDRELCISKTPLSLDLLSSTEDIINRRIFTYWNAIWPRNTNDGYSSSARGSGERIYGG